METNFNANVNTNLETNHVLDLSDRLYKLLAGAGIIVAVLFAGWVFAEFRGLPQNMPHEINITGEGKAFIKPDVAMINFGVHSEALKSQDVVNQNNQKMNAVIKAIKHF